MKKFIAITLCVVALVAMFTGCNQSMGLGSFNFKKVHVDTYHYYGCLTVEKWHDNESGVEVKTKEAGAIFLSEGTYILLEDDEECPFCGKGEGE